MTTLQHRALGALTGLALGDALGMPTQSMSRERIARETGPITGLVDAIGVDEDGAVLVDHHDRPQWLCGVWRTAVLKERIEGVSPGTGMRQVLGDLRYAHVHWLDGDLPAWFDCDTPQALEYARRLDREFRRRS